MSKKLLAASLTVLSAAVLSGCASVYNPDISYDPASSRAHNVCAAFGINVDDQAPPAGVKFSPEGSLSPDEIVKADRSKRVYILDWAFKAPDNPKANVVFGYVPAADVPQAATANERYDSARSLFVLGPSNEFH